MQRIGIGGVDQHHASDALTNELRVVADQRLDRHAADAVAHEHDAVFGRTLDDLTQTLRERRQGDRVRLDLRAPKTRQIPDDQRMIAAQIA